MWQEKNNNQKNKIIWKKLANKCDKIKDKKCGQNKYVTKNYKNCDKHKWTKQTISEETFWGEKMLQNVVTKISD